MVKSEEKPFQLIAGNTALDLVNTLDSRFAEHGPEELLQSYSDLLRFTTQAGLLNDAATRRLKRIAAASKQECTRVLEDVKRMREALAVVVYALRDGQKVSAENLILLETYFKQASAQRKLSAQGTHLRWTWPTSRDEMAAPLWMLAQEAADLLLSDQTQWLRGCAAETCQWLFLDTSKNHTRRWCDMKVCGNRMKARRFQQRVQ